MTRPIMALGCGALFALLTSAVLQLPTAPAGLVNEALSDLGNSGVEHPVTAVLLNYRSYDTLLEIAVLLLAITAVWAISATPHQPVTPRGKPLLLPMVRIIFPIIIVTAGYLLWIGAFAPGGAFQGGALLGGGVVLLLLAGITRWVWAYSNWLRVGLCLGVAVFAAVAGITLALNGHLLEYPRGSAGTWILVIEAAALLSIGLTLGLLFLGGRPLPQKEQRTEP